MIGIEGIRPFSRMFEYQGDKKAEQKKGQKEQPSQHAESV
jgi:hypothetical protein